MAIVLALVSVIAMNAHCAAQSDADTSLASIDDYLSAHSDAANTYQFPWLGIEVTNGEGTLEHRYRFEGIKVMAVLPSSPGAVAGLRGERQHVQAALTVGLLAASLFFPPAMLGVAALGSSELGQSHQFIIAVDGARTRDVNDFGAALDQVQPGEVVYLTVVGDGQRKQLRVVLPDVPSQFARRR